MAPAELQGMAVVRQVRIEVWFDFASPYSFLTVMRLEALVGTGSLRVCWRPFVLGAIFRRKGLQTSPFVLDAAKGRYMWRDVERRAESYGLPFLRPGCFPMNGVGAARIMTAAEDAPWAPGFARAVFASEFVRGEDIAEEAVLATCLEQAGVDPRDWLPSLKEESVRATLRARTEEAWAHGIFGAPTFRVKQELFWGDDRLEDAISWTMAAPSRPTGG